MRILIIIILIGVSLVGACENKEEASENTVNPGQVFYFPNATVRTVGFDTLYETEDRLRFTIPKEWALMQSTEIWMVEDDSPRVKLENTLDSKFSNFSNGQEQLLIARQYNIVDPAMLVSVSLLRHSDKQSNTQSGLAEFTLHPEFEQRTQEYQRDILKRFDGDPRLLEYTWVDGGVGEYGDWMCTFHIIDTTMADGVENTHLSLICPAGARTIKLIGIITRENRDTVLSEISKFVASMDVTETNWMVE